MCLLLLLLALVIPIKRIPEILVPVLGLLSFVVLFLTETEDRLNLPNLFTVSRIIVGLGVFFYVTSAPVAALGTERSGSYPVFLLLVCIEVTDFIDGYVARRVGATSYGARLDMEVDAFFMYLLAYIAHFQAGLGSWVLAIGAYRYIFAFTSHFLPENGESHSRVFKLFAKTVCALSVIALISVTAPFLPYVAKAWLNIASLVLLTASFLWEAALRLRTALLHRKPVHE
jgi:phosphatidylglycerophosphate synthase